MRARVTLRGLAVELGPVGAEVVPWNDLGRLGPCVFTHFDVHGEPIHRGLKGFIRLKDSREGHVADRLYARAMKRAFHDGTLEIRRSFRSEIQGQRINSVIIGALLLAMVWLVVFNFGGPWYSGLGMLGLTLLPVVAVWWTSIRPLPYYGSRGVLRASLTPEMIFIERRNGTREEFSFDDAKRLELSGVPLIEFRNGTIVRVPGIHGVRAMLKMIQRERFPDATEREKRTLHRSLIRSSVYFMLGGVAAGLMTWFLQRQGLLPASRWRPLGVAIGLGIGMPGVLVLSFVLQTWATSGVPPWKKKAWTEMFR